MELLIASVLALCAGPVFFELLSRRPAIMSLADGFVLMSVIGLVVVHLLPEALLLGGWPAAAAAAIGFALPITLDRFLHQASERPHGHGDGANSAFLWVIIVGLALHAALDGAALAPHGDGASHGHDHGHGEHGGDSLLGFAVILHRVPLGLILWWLARPAWGARVAAGVIAVMLGATVAGFAAGGHLLEALPADALSVFQALIAGGLIHIAFHHPPMLDRRFPKAQLLGGIGGAAALVIVALAAWSHPIEAQVPGGLSFGETLWRLVANSAPALLAAFVVAAVVHALLRAPTLSWLRGGTALGRIGRGAVFGLRLPISACGVLPLYQRLSRVGVPLGAGLAFLSATPALGIDALAISLPLLGWELTLTRLVLALLVAASVAFVMCRVMGDTAHAGNEPPAAPAPGVSKGLLYGFGELVDHSAPWLAVGIIVAAFVEASFTPETLGALDGGLDVVLFALLGMPLYIGATGSTPLAALLLMNGVSAGAVMALLLTGPSINSATFAVLDSLHGKAAARRFVLVLVLAAVALGLVVNAVLPKVGELGLTLDSADGPLQVGAAVLLGLLALTSLLRRGPRYLIEGMTPHMHTMDDSDGHHDHHHDHPHEDHHHPGGGHHH